MPLNRYKDYLEDEVLEANPLQLIEMLYRGALGSIAAAKRHLRSGDIRARSASISKAMAIVTELSLSLNHREGGEISANLAALYGYIEKLLIQANREQRQPPLSEAETLLSTLLEGWSRCVRFQSPTAEDAPGTRPAERHEAISCAY